MEDDEDRQGKPTYNLIFRLFLGTAITVENIILLYVIVKNRLNTSTYLFTASLGATDLLVGISILFGAPFYFPAVAAKLGSRSIGTSIFTIVVIGMLLLSISQMATIAVERYLYIVHPFWHERHMTGRTVSLLIAIIWILGAVLTTSLGVAQLHGVGNYINGVGNGMNIVVTITGLSIYFLITIVTLVCYLLILIQVRKMRRSMPTVGSTQPAPISNISDITTIPISDSDDTNTNTKNKKSAGKRKNKNSNNNNNNASATSGKWRDHIKDLKFFLAVFGVFFFTTAPAATTETVVQFVEINESLRNTLLLIGIANSGMNFWILYAIDTQFKQKLKNSLCTCKN